MPNVPQTPDRAAVTRRDVEFQSGRHTLRGWLFLPPSSEPANDSPEATSGLPGVVMAEGFSGVKEIGLEYFALPLAEAGIATLGFDYPYFGASDGRPRQRLDPMAQLQAYRSAMTYIAARDEIDAERLGLWGASFAGGHVLSLCGERAPVRCGMAVVPFLGVSIADVMSQTVRGFRRGIPDLLQGRVPVVSSDPRGFAIMANPEAYTTLTTAAGERAPAWRNWITPDSLPRIMRYRPIRAAARIETPVRLVTMSEDIVTPPEPVRALAGKLGAHADLHPLTGAHFDILGAQLPRLQALTVDWFSAQLAAGDR